MSGEYVVDGDLIARVKHMIDSNLNGVGSAKYEFEKAGYLYFTAKDKQTNQTLIVRTPVENFATEHEYRRLWQKSWYELTSGEKYPNR